mgnify:CR=1 FL=1
MAPGSTSLCFERSARKPPDRLTHPSEKKDAGPRGPASPSVQAAADRPLKTGPSDGTRSAFAAGIRIGVVDVALGDFAVIGGAVIGTVIGHVAVIGTVIGHVAVVG